LGDIPDSAPRFSVVNKTNSFLRLISSHNAWVEVFVLPFYAAAHRWLFVQLSTYAALALEIVVISDPVTRTARSPIRVLCPSTPKQPPPPPAPVTPSFMEHKEHSVFSLSTIIAPEEEEEEKKSSASKPFQ